jgi:hypothetical protein
VSVWRRAGVKMRTASELLDDTTTFSTPSTPSTPSPRRLRWLLRLLRFRQLHSRVTELIRLLDWDCRRRRGRA